MYRSHILPSVHLTESGFSPNWLFLFRSSFDTKDGQLLKFYRQSDADDFIEKHERAIDKEAFRTERIQMVARLKEVCILTDP